MVFQEPSSITGTADVEYCNMTNNLTILNNIGSLTTNIPGVNTLYTSALTVPMDVRNSPRDVWGWPKIPLLHTLPQNHSLDSENPWRLVSNNSNITYSSLVGNILQGVPIDLDTEFAIESSYLDLRCRLLDLSSDPDDAFASMGGALMMHNASNLFRLPGFVQAYSRYTIINIR
jgi:hypothetical protein